MSLDVSTESDRPAILYLDRDQDASIEFRQHLESTGDVIPCHDLNTHLALMRELPGSYSLLDTATLLDSPTAEVSQLSDFRRTRHLGLVSGQELEEYIFSLRTWGVVQCLSKSPETTVEEIEHFLAMLKDPASGFGLIRYLSSTVQMVSVSVDSMASKVATIERVINHFATCGFEVHELYDVRLILEEITNNAFFHAFQTASGEEKYNVSNFTKLGENESVRIEYGSDSRRVGFSVTDSAGTLPIGVVLTKLERQLNREGIFDESGRGLYLSRMLATRMIFNIEQNRRTQLIALFDDNRKKSRAVKPLLVNYSGQDTFHEWGVDPEFD